MFLTKSKKFIIVLIVTLLVSVFSITSVTLLIINKNEENKKNNLKVSAAMDLRDFCVFDENGEYDTLISDYSAVYKNNSSFTISDKMGLVVFITFSKTFNDGFANKTVRLECDLDLNGAEFCISRFNGTFDGGGNTLSNVKMPKYEFYTIKGDYNAATGINTKYCYGLFLYLGKSATVKNLCLKNIMGNPDPSEPDSTMEIVVIAPIAGYVEGGAIYNCEIDGFTDGFASYKSSRLSSGLFAYGYANVDNCLVQNINVMAGSFYNFGPAFRQKGHMGANVTTNIIACVFNSSNFIKSNKTSYSNKHGATVSGDTLNVSITYSTNIGDGFKDLDIGSYGESKGSYWYRASEYNNGWPLLRMFMDWNKVIIKANPDKSALIDKTIYIPIDAKNSYLDSGKVLNNGKEAKIVIYDQEVNVTAKDGYVCTEWKCESVTSYTIFLEKNTCTLMFTQSFLETTSQGSSYIIPYNQNTGKMETDSNLVLEVSEGSIITVNINVDKNGYVKNEYIITYNGTEIKIVYELTNKKFQIDDWGIDIEAQYVVTEDLIITPTFKLKEYGWIFM